MEDSIGVFALMSVMTAIIAGSTAVRLVFVESEYRRMIELLTSKIKEFERQLSTHTESSHDKFGKSRVQSLVSETVSDLSVRRAVNKTWVTIDGFCITTILIVGLLTALGFGTSLSASLVTILIFLSAMIPFYIHIKNTLEATYTFHV